MQAYTGETQLLTEEKRIYEDPTSLIVTRMVLNAALMVADFSFRLPFMSQDASKATDIIEFLVAGRRLVQTGINMGWGNSGINKYIRMIDLLPDINPFIGVATEAADLFVWRSDICSYVVPGLMQTFKDVNELRRRGFFG